MHKIVIIGADGLQMKWRWLKLSLLLIGTLFLTGCPNTVGNLLVTKTQKEKELAALRIEYEKKLEVARTEEAVSKDKVITGKDNQIGQAAVGLYGADQTFKSILIPTRTDLITNNFVNEAWIALGRPTPPYEEIQKTNSRLKDELNETKTSLADLKRNHDAAVAQNQKLVDASLEYQKELVKAHETTKTVAAERDTKLASKQSELIEVQGKLIAAEKARADDAVALQALKTKMSFILGALALVGIAGTIYSPVWKEKCAIFAVICGAAAIGIWYIQAWHVAIVASLAVVGLVIWALIKHRKEEKLSDALSLGFNDAKGKAADAYAIIEPLIAERMRKYVKRDGKLVTTEDPALKAHLDEKLASWDTL